MGGSDINTSQRTDHSDRRVGRERPGETETTAPVRTPDEGSPARAQAPSERTDNWGLPLAVVVVGMFMSVLDTSIVNVAIPTMQKQFNVTADDIEWVSTTYTLCLGVIVPTSAWLGDRIGLRKLYLISLIAFAVFSALCGTATDLPTMVVYRILQAIPGGVIPVTCLTILYRMVPPDKVGAAMGLYGFGIVVAPGVGPAMGGYLVEYVDWRLIFYINVPIGILGAVAAVFILPDFSGASTRRFDAPGFLCVAAGLFALLLAVSEGQIWGWTSYPVLILLIVSLNLLVLFVAVELWVPEPLLDVRVFTSVSFVRSLVLVVITYMGMFGVLYLWPQFLQNDQNLTPMNTGLVLLPQAAVMGVLMPFAGRIYDRIGARWPAVIGLTLITMATVMMIGVRSDSTRPEIIAWMMVRAAGMGICMMPIMTAGISALPTRLSSVGSAYNTLFQRVSSALGVSAMTAMSTANAAQVSADRSALSRPGVADTPPGIEAVTSQGPHGVIGLWEQVQAQVLAESYRDVFVALAVMSALGIPLAFLLRGRPSVSGEAAEPIEAG
jgi:EmrB/QacA subfamily drug resistance transporter